MANSISQQGGGGQIVICVILLILSMVACQSVPDLDAELQTVIQAQRITRLDPGPAQDPALVALGQALYFDKILSGNRDIACATCHHPHKNSGDDLPISIGTGGVGLGETRQIGNGRQFIPRNAPEVFNRGAAEWRTMFWDSRVMLGEDGRFQTPAGAKLPATVANLLAAQAMFPVTSNDEMRGAVGDTDVFGQPNELALIDSDDLPSIWQALMNRVLAIPEYQTLFAAAYPDVPMAELDFGHAANAIAAFEIEAYTFYHTPWYQYLEGDTLALSDDAKSGALLFFGEAGCSRCHSGPLFTDQQHHNLAVPQVGPGKGDYAPLDLGRFSETGNLTDKYAFRTPPLHNVTISGPWMHNGAFNTLEAVIEHHLDTEKSLQGYDTAVHLPPDLRGTFQNDPALLDEMLQTVDPQLAPARKLSAQEIQQLIAFLEALTDPGVAENIAYLVPTAVPSGLSVDVVINREGE
ncbi:MAG: cytochrome-c peroxidase [Ardenticatenaceae bacterium]|nr:cytochrome-c peroxidase [Ardenticatenaceae bacterium]